MLPREINRLRRLYTLFYYTMFLKSTIYSFLNLYYDFKVFL
jgi:hypothetical protein